MAKASRKTASRKAISMRKLRELVESYPLPHNELDRIERWARRRMSREDRQVLVRVALCIAGGQMPEVGHV